MSWWEPIDREAIMRFGHSVNFAIPEDPNEAIFPQLPGDRHVAIRIRPPPSVQAPLCPVQADGEPHFSNMSMATLPAGTNPSA
jgi:hypothetical protein